MSAIVDHRAAFHAAINAGIGDRRAPCPECGRGPRDDTCGITVDRGGAVWHCFRCGHRGAARHNRSTTYPARRPERPVTAPEKRRGLSDWGRKLWNECRPLEGVALAYLEHRRCALPPADGDLRFHAALKHPSGYTGPALVGLIRDCATGEPLSLHRTWITATGKADVQPPRLFLAKHDIKGGAIMLWPSEAVTDGLAVAEGTESALAAAHVYRPAWALMDAGHLRAFPVLGGIESLVIFADHDEAGLGAARECARRWLDAGRGVTVSLPPDQGCDFADLAEVAK